MATPCEAATERAANWTESRTSPDHDLVRQLQSGDELAYRSFVERYQRRILRLAYGILRNQGDAEEIAQLVFVKVFLSIKSFAGRSSLFAWIHRIAANECYSILRKRAFVVSLDAPDPDAASSASLRTCKQPGPAWDTVVLQRNYLNRLLAALPEQDRHLLLLREVEGFSMAELADATGVNENSVRIRLFRARQRLARAAGLQPHRTMRSVRSDQK